MNSEVNDLYHVCQQAYGFFNDRLFEGQLPAVAFVLDWSSKNAMGYFSNAQFVHCTDEDPEPRDIIALNPLYFHETDLEILSTLAHEMVHCWQQHFGKRVPKTNHHNREWADKMEDIGLIPSDTGQPGGARTGRKVSHYINDPGAYLDAATAFLKRNKDIFSRIEIQMMTVLKYHRTIQIIIEITLIDGEAEQARQEDDSKD